MSVVAENVNEKIVASIELWKPAKAARPPPTSRSSRAKPARCMLEIFTRMTSEDYVEAFKQLQHFGKKAHQAKTEMVEANLRLHFHRQEIHQPRPVLPRPHSGGQHGPDEGGRGPSTAAATSSPPMRPVDSPGHHAFHRRSARTIRIPVHMIETINKLMRVQKQLAGFRP